MQVRYLDNEICDHFNKYKQILVLLGARQVGKTTILKKIFPTAKYLEVDSEVVRSALEKYDSAVYQELLTNEDSNIVILDEIHKLSDPGRAAKIIYDQLPQFKLIITGSSSFRIKNKTSESLAGRKIDYQLFPLTLSEYLVQTGLEKKLSDASFEKLVNEGKLENVIRSYDSYNLLNQRLIFGMYPEMIFHPSDSRYLLNLIDSVVFKDMLDLNLLENKSAALSLLKLLAYQIGSLINYHELSVNLGIGEKTVKRYVELFEQSFIIFTLKPFSLRKRDEISKMPKVYFYDLGLRNALINNFSSYETRGDKGQLYENFIISEICKMNSYKKYGFNLNYWRTKSGSEIDLVLSQEGRKNIAIEIKTQAKRVNKAFVERYPDSKLVVLTRENFWV